MPSICFHFPPLTFQMAENICCRQTKCSKNKIVVNNKMVVNIFCRQQKCRQQQNRRQQKMVGNCFCRPGKCRQTGSRAGGSRGVGRRMTEGGLRATSRKRRLAASRAATDGGRAAAAAGERRAAGRAGAGAGAGAAAGAGAGAGLVGRPTIGDQIKTSTQSRKPKPRKNACTEPPRSRMN
jgi:hypothetical protein